MKKILLLLFVLIAMESFAIKNRVYVYQNCNGVRGNPIFVGDDATDYNYYAIGCFDLCKGCKLEITMLDFSGNPGYTPKGPNSRLTWSTDGVIGYDIYGGLIEENGIKYASFDISNIPIGAEFYIKMGTTRLEFRQDCNKFIPANNKDNIEFGNKSICKGVCLHISDLIPNILNPDFSPKADVISYGCGTNPTVPLNGNRNINYNQVCFNDVGTFPLCATVKDACGEKIITGSIEVTECDVDGNPIYCKSCCASINSTVSNLGSWYSFGKLTIPTSIFGCGIVDYQIFFADGTSIFARGSGQVNLGGKKPISICILPLNCPSCQVCFQVPE